METTLTPVQQAEAARQVVGVLRRMQRRFDQGKWCRGARFGRNGGNCLLGAVDEATSWTIPGVSDQIIDELVAGLPAGFATVARWRPQLALAAYNDTVGGNAGAARLVDEALARLVGTGPSRPATVVASRDHQPA